MEVLILNAQSDAVAAARERRRSEEAASRSVQLSPADLSTDPS